MWLAHSQAACECVRTRQILLLRLGLCVCVCVEPFWQKQTHISLMSLSGLPAIEPIEHRAQLYDLWTVCLNVLRFNECARGLKTHDETIRL